MKKFFSAYELKWLAIIFMTIDHFGVLVLLPFDHIPFIASLYLIFRLIGRLAFPLFAFMIAEGVFRSRKPYRYWSRLFLMAILIGLAMYVLSLIGINALAGNIFIDLSMAALVMILLKEKFVFKKILSLAPLLYLVWVSLDRSLPNYLVADYGLYGLLMMLVFFIFYTPQVGQLFRRWLALGDDHIRRYQLMSVAMITMHILWYIIFLVIQEANLLSNTFGNYISRFVGVQTYAVFAVYFIYRYQGDKGMAPKWFQRFTYLYYPLHFVALYGIYLVLNAISIMT